MFIYFIHFAFDKVSVDILRNLIYSYIGSNWKRFIINLITLGIATLIPFVFSFGPFILMVFNTIVLFFVDYKILFDRINCHKYSHVYFHLNVDFVMLIGHQMYGQYIMFSTKLCLLLVRKYIIS